MISRRAAIQLGVVAGGVGIGGFVAHRAGVLDDGLRAVGVRPHAEPDPHDVALLAAAAAGQTELLAALDSLQQAENRPQAGGNLTANLAGLRAVLGEQLAAVSDQPSATPMGAPAVNDADVTAFAERVEATAAARADGALSAGSLAVIKVLAAMSAGLEQVAVAARTLA
jgi:hypothetical protein